MAIRRACESVTTMAGHIPCSLIVVANGHRASPAVLDWLGMRPDVRLVRVRSGSAPLARRIGAEIADSEFLGFLDDDDEMLPRTLERKLAFFRDHPEVDVLVSDGLRVDGAAESRILPPPGARGADHIETMMRAGWSACSLTLRTRTVDLAAFDPLFCHMEWTLTALRLAHHHEVGLLDEPTYRYHGDTPGSLSKSVEHSLAAPEVWRRLCALYAGTRHEEAMRRRHGIECHNASWKSAELGRLRDAWRLHAESLRSPGGIRAYLTYSRKLLRASLRQARS